MRTLLAVCLMLTLMAFAQENRLPKECVLPVCTTAKGVEAAMCADTRPNWCIKLEEKRQHDMCTKWEADHPRKAMPLRKDWSAAMCEVPRTQVSDDYVRFCAKHGNLSAACIAGCEGNQPGQWMASAGAYLEVDDCQWHSGKNPREHERGQK